MTRQLKYKNNNYPNIVKNFNYSSIFNNKIEKKIEKHN